MKDVSLKRISLTGKVLMVAILCVARAESQGSHPLPIASLNRTEPVDFEREILPFLKESCLACHNQTKAKADLILETPQTILKGGESGPAALPGRPAESLVFKAASHTDEPFMPPKDNKANAPELNPQQLALLKLWIEQGARGEIRGGQPIAWQPLAGNVRPILALAVTSDAQFAACGKGNELFLYQLPARRTIGPIADPDLQKHTSAQTRAAHLDLITSIDFSPDGELLASGSYREVKVWRRQHNLPISLPLTSRKEVRLLSSSSSSPYVALAFETGRIEIWKFNGNEAEKIIETGSEPLRLVEITAEGTYVAAVSESQLLRVWNVADGKILAEAKLEKETHALAWVAEGKQLATAGLAIQLWILPSDGMTNLIRGKMLTGHQDSIAAIEPIGGEGQELLSASRDGTIRLWNISSGEQLRSFDHGAPVIALDISLDGKRLASGGQNRTIRLWNVSDGAMLNELKGEYRAQYSVTQARRAVTYAKNLADYRKTAVEAALKEQQSQVERVRKASEAAANADKALAEKEQQITDAKAKQVAGENELAAVRAELKKLQDKSENAEAALLQAKTAARNERQTAIQLQLAAHVAQMKAEFEKILTNALIKVAGVGPKTNETALVPPEETDAARNTNSTALAERALVDKFLDEIASKAVDAAISRQALTNFKAEFEKKEKTADEKIKAAQKAVADTEAAVKPLRLAKSASDNEMHFAIHGAQKALDACTEAQNALQLDETELKHRETLFTTAGINLTNSMQVSASLAFSRDGATLAAAYENGLVTIWNVEAGSPLETIQGSGGRSLLAFADDHVLLTFAEGRLHAWETVPSWKLDQVLAFRNGDPAFADRVNALRFSPDGQFLATGGGEPSRSGELKVWRVIDRQLVHDFKNLHSDVVLALAFTADGRYLASGSADRFAKITDLGTGKLVRALEGHTHHVLGVSWKRDGHTLMTAGGDNLIKVWDALSGEKKKNIEGFGKEVTAVCFLGDTDQALACSGDNTIRLIKENGEKVRSFEGSTDFLQVAAAAPDGAIVLAGGQDGILRIWQTETGKLIASYPER